MKIGILGAGSVGGELGRLWVQHGHDVVFGVRDPQKLSVKDLIASTDGQARAADAESAAEHGEVVVVATPYAVVADLLPPLADHVVGKTVIDATNRFGGRDDAPSGAAYIASLLPDANVVKAFNTIGANRYGKTDFDGQAASMFICGDDAGAKATTAELAVLLGFDPVDCGPLNNAHLLENLAQLWIWQARNGAGRDIAFKLLKG